MRNFEKQKSNTQYRCDYDTMIVSRDCKFFLSLTYSRHLPDLHPLDKDKSEVDDGFMYTWNGL